MKAMMPELAADPGLCLEDNCKDVHEPPLKFMTIESLKKSVPHPEEQPAECT